MQKPSKFNPEIFFETKHLEEDLKRRSVRGGTVTLASQGFRFALQMGTTAVLARLLTPEDYGLVGMTSVVTGFIELFRDLGLSEATVQQQEINHKQVSTLFWINCAVGFGLMVLAIGLSPLVANFYNEPRVVGIMSALSVNFLVSSAAAQHSALLRRQMRFTALAVINIVSMALGTIVAVISAQMGASYWALVFMFITGVLAYAIGAWIACGWRPGGADFKSGIGEMLLFGGNLTGFNIVNYFSRNFDNILIGRVWGPIELGLYAKAYQLVLLPVNQINAPITNVAMPTLSRLQSNPDKYKRYYYEALLIISAVGMPIVCFLFVAANDIIMLTLGEQWTEAVPIFRYLMPAAFIGTFGISTGWAFQSLGRTGEQFRLGIITSVINVLIFITSVRWGALGVAAGYGLSRPLIMALTIIVCYKGTFLTVRDFLKTLFWPATASLSSSALLILLTQYVDNEPVLIVRILAEFSLYFFIYSLIMLITPENRSRLIEGVRFLKK